ncbi:MAG: hypothetical protein KKH80_02570 [Candidatus Omnitrophica bacterium]|nr:hypothetical protein [Candidatus Omnitrophota bacterium]MBU1871667.1 hypothetical protein [Candidatus Omnitrophota bacterium]
MQFIELKEEVKNIAAGEMREDEENYLELVVLKGKIDDVCRKLEELLGPPAFPSENKLTPEIENIVNKYGGIFQGQTLYFSSQNNSTVFAMLWPWGSGMHVTVKLIHQ